VPSRSFKRKLEVKVVTLDGSIIAKNGNMTGGVSSLGESWREETRASESLMSMWRASLLR
jgi:chromosome segregation ATPase